METEYKDPNFCDNRWNPVSCTPEQLRNAGAPSPVDGPVVPFSPRAEMSMGQRAVMAASDMYHGLFD